MALLWRKGRLLIHKLTTRRFPAPTEAEFAVESQSSSLPDASSRRWPHTFAIISWGCAGTSWLSKTLNSHAEILCVHDWRKHMSRFAPRYRRVNDVEALDALHNAGENYQCVGDVHSVLCNSIPAVVNHFSNRGISIAGITRDPLPRLRSQLALFARHNYDHRLWGDLRYLRREPGFDQVKEVIEGSAKYVCFAHGAVQLNAINIEATAIPRIFRLEDLTTLPQHFADFVSYLSGGRIAPDLAEAQEMIGLRPVNQHRKVASPAVEFDFNELRILQAMVLPESWDRYKEFGYERPVWANSRWQHLEGGKAGVAKAA